MNEATKLATEEAQEEAKEGMEDGTMFPCRTCSFFEIVGTTFPYLMYIKLMDDEL